MTPTLRSLFPKQGLILRRGALFGSDTEDQLREVWGGKAATPNHINTALIEFFDMLCELRVKWGSNNNAQIYTELRQRVAWTQGLTDNCIEELIEVCVEGRERHHEIKSLDTRFSKIGRSIDLWIRLNSDRRRKHSVTEEPSYYKDDSDDEELPDVEDEDEQKSWDLDTAAPTRILQIPEEVTPRKKPSSISTSNTRYIPSITSPRRLRKFKQRDKTKDESKTSPAPLTEDGQYSDEMCRLQEPDNAMVIDEAAGSSRPDLERVFKELFGPECGDSLSPPEPDGAPEGAPETADHDLLPAPVFTMNLPFHFKK